ncbi:hypothetical protein L6R50_24490 [Myxococcota bacterium]|nr:hypothetical protein [Myxococcota bacterium]
MPAQSLTSGPGAAPRSARPARLVAALLAAILACAASAGCVRRHPAPPPLLSEGECRDIIEGSFGNQDASVLAVRPLRGGTVFTPETLAAVARLTDAIQREATTDTPMVLSLTSSPFLRPASRGVQVFRIADELPETRSAADALARIVYSFDLVVNNLVSLPPGSVTYIHLPRVAFEGKDPRSLLQALRTQELETLLIALDDGSPEGRTEYAEVAGSGPSADHVEVMFQAREGEDMKDPDSLSAVVDFQRHAEALPLVAQSYSVTDDIMLARRYLFRGNPAEGRIPNRRAAVGQALLAWSLSGNAETMGTRLSSDERVALVRVGLRVARDAEQRSKTVEDLRHLAAAAAARTGMRSIVCP